MSSRVALLLLVSVVAVKILSQWLGLFYEQEKMTSGKGSIAFLWYKSYAVLRKSKSGPFDWFRFVERPGMNTKDHRWQLVLLTRDGAWQDDIRAWGQVARQQRYGYTCIIINIGLSIL